MAEPSKHEDGAFALLLVAAGIGVVFLGFRLYYNWKFKKLAK